MTLPRSGLARMAVAALALMAGSAGCGDDGPSPSAADAAASRRQTFGRGALPSEATRTVEIRMLDDMRFEPARLEVAPGEVVTFRLVNAGKVPHEFTIGGPDAQELHDAQMAAMDTAGGAEGMGGMKMNMSEGSAADGSAKPMDEKIALLEERAAFSDSRHVAPGASEELAWAFTGPEMPSFACHVPGHWKAGMAGTIASPAGQ